MLRIIPFLLILTRIQAPNNANNGLCRDLLDGCSLYDDRFVCSKFNVKPKISYNVTYPNCWINSFRFYFNLNKPTILDTSFNLSRTEEITQNIIYSEYSNNRYYLMRNIRGFDINFNVYPKYIRYFYLTFYETRFEFYSNGKPIEKCDDLTPGIYPAPFFSLIWSERTIIHFKTVKFTTRICPLVFNYNSLYTVRFDNLIYTFYKRNILELYHLNNVTDINSFIKELNLYNMEKVELNSVLLNNLVFKHIEMLMINGEVKSIQAGLLRSYKRLKILIMDSFFLRPLFHRQGADWIRDLNTDVYLDLENRSKIERLMNIKKYVMFNIDMSRNYMPYYLDRDYLFKVDLVFPDEDFCLYKNFPFNQLVIMSFTSRVLYFGINAKYSCTFIWFIQYYDIYSEYIPGVNRYLMMNLSEEIKKCDFKKR
jgi:hypothetical protein